MTGSSLDEASDNWLREGSLVRGTRALLKHHKEKGTQRRLATVLARTVQPRASHTTSPSITDEFSTRATLRANKSGCWVRGRKQTTETATGGCEGSSGPRGTGRCRLGPFLQPGDSFPRGIPRSTRRAKCDGAQTLGESLARQSQAEPGARGRGRPPSSRERRGGRVFTAVLFRRGRPPVLALVRDGAQRTGKPQWGFLL